MRLSFNVLVIDHFKLWTDRTRLASTWNAEMRAWIKFHCNETGNHYRSFEMVASGQAYSQQEAIKRMIQRFMDGQVLWADWFHNRKYVSESANKVHEIKIEVGEPFTTMFYELFDMATWNIDKAYNPNGVVFANGATIQMDDQGKGPNLLGVDKTQLLFSQQNG